MLLKIMLSSLLILSLSGCETIKYVERPPLPPLVLPWPTPLDTCIITSVQITDQGLVQMTYEDNINVAVCERDMLRYIKDLKSMICKHQPKDKECND